MIADIPRPQQQALQGATFDREWYKFFRDVAKSLGFTKSPPIYGGQMKSSAEIILTNTDGYQDVIYAKMQPGDSSDVWALFELPNNYKEGTPLSFFLKYFLDDSNPGTIIYSGSFGKRGSLTGYSGILASAESTDDQILEIGEMDGSNINRNSGIELKFQRDGDDADDNYGDHLNIIGLCIRYQLSGVGSEQINGG